MDPQSGQVATGHFHTVLEFPLLKATAQKKRGGSSVGLISGDQKHSFLFIKDLKTTPLSYFTLLEN